jgi:hypothetical protein
MPMKEEQLPEPFNHYWKMSKTLPKMKTPPLQKDHLSKEWNSFIEAVSNRVKRDLENEK